MVPSLARCSGCIPVCAWAAERTLDRLARPSISALWNVADMIIWAIQFAIVACN